MSTGYSAQALELTAANGQVSSGTVPVAGNNAMLAGLERGRFALL